MDSSKKDTTNDIVGFKRICLPHQKELDLPFYISTFGVSRDEIKVKWGSVAKCFLVYSINGCGKAYIDGKWEKAPEGSLIYIPSHTEMQYEPIDENRWSTAWITFSGQLAESLLPHKSCVIEGNHSYVYDFVTFLNEIYEREDFYEHSSSMLYFALLRLRRMTGNSSNAAVSKGDKRRKVANTIKYITEHFTQDLAVTLFAEQCGISEEYYCKLFKRIVGSTPISYINSLRIAHACDLLKKSPDRKIEVVAKECGFNNISYFNRLFKKETGLSPGEYRSNNNT